MKVNKFKISSLIIDTNYNPTNNEELEKFLNNLSKSTVYEVFQILQKPLPKKGWRYDVIEKLKR